MSNGEHVIHLRGLMDSIKSFYPELYTHIFDNDDLPHTALRIFLKKNNIIHLTSVEAIWDHIRCNRELHDWWML